MNNVILMGRLTRDPDLRYYQSGSGAVARFTLAVDKQLTREKRQELESRNQPTADFINIVAWGKLGENCAKFTQRGNRVLVSGRLQSGSYDDKDGKKVYTTDVVAANVEFIDWKDNGPSQAGQNYGNNSYNNSQNQNNSGQDQGNGPDDFANDGFDFGASDFDPTSDDTRIPF